MSCMTIESFQVEPADGLLLLACLVPEKKYRKLGGEAGLEAALKRCLPTERKCKVFRVPVEDIWVSFRGLQRDLDLDQIFLESCTAHFGEHKGAIEYEFACNCCAVY